MRSLNQCAQCGFSESVVRTARGETGGGVIAGLDFKGRARAGHICV